MRLLSCRSLSSTCLLAALVVQPLAGLAASPQTLYAWAQTSSDAFSVAPVHPPLEVTVDGAPYLYGVMRYQATQHDAYEINLETGSTFRHERLSATYQGNTSTGFYSDYVEWQGKVYVIGSDSVYDYIHTNRKVMQLDTATFTSAPPEVVDFEWVGEASSYNRSRLNTLRSLALDDQRGIVFASGARRYSIMDANDWPPEFLEMLGLEEGEVRIDFDTDSAILSFNLQQQTWTALKFAPVASPVDASNAGVPGEITALVYNAAENAIYGVAQSIHADKPGEFLPEGRRDETVSGVLFKASIPAGWDGQSELTDVTTEFLHVFTFEADFGGPQLNKEGSTSTIENAARFGGALLADGDFLYGTTQSYQHLHELVTPPESFNELGTVWRFNKTTGAFATVHRFSSDQGAKGNAPAGKLALAADGNIYGTTQFSGNTPIMENTNRNGTGGVIYRVITDQTNADRRADRVELVHRFTPVDINRDTTVGPNGLAASADGWTLYGITHFGSPIKEGDSRQAGSAGTVYKLAVPEPDFVPSPTPDKKSSGSGSSLGLLTLFSLGALLLRRRQSV